MKRRSLIGLAPALCVTLKQLNETLAEVLAAPDMREKLAVEAIEPMPQTAEEFGRYIRNDIARWTALARERHIEPDN